MKADKKPVQNYITARNNVMNFFNCQDDIFIKVLDKFEWFIKDNDDFHMLSYWDANDNRVDAIVVKKGGDPMVFKTEGYTMVVAIDCVKIGFIFNNQNSKNE